jgi:hypothetical protein
MTGRTGGAFSCAGRIAGMFRKHVFTCLSLFLVALLIAAWVANFFGQVGIGTRSGEFDRHFTFRSGSLSISQHDNSMVQGLFWRTYPTGDALALAAEFGDLSSLSARLRFTNSSSRHWSLEVPILLLITAMIPLVVVSLSGSRFRLWQVFAFTTVVALELAYFVR